MTNADVGGGGEVDDFVEVLDLPVADEDEEPVALERAARDVGLLLPVEAARLAQAVPVELNLSVLRPDEPLEPRGRGGVVASDLLADSQPDQIADGDRVRYVGHVEAVELLAGRRLVAEGHCWHGAIVASRSNGSA